LTTFAELAIFQRSTFVAVTIKFGYLLTTATRLRFILATRVTNTRTVMPFGLTNTPSTFQLTMNRVFRDLLDKCMIICLDDILVYRKTREQHLKDLEAVFQRLQQNRLITKGSKCEFLKQEMEFLGHVISMEGITLQSFLGFVNNVQRSKNLLMSPPVLCIVDPERPFEVVTDTSDIAIGAVLMQDFGDRLQPIAYESRKMQYARHNYLVHDKEMLTFFHAFKIWRCYMTGADVMVRTDHKSLQYLRAQPNLNPRQIRWLDYLDSNMVSLCGRLSDLPVNEIITPTTDRTIAAPRATSTPMATCDDGFRHRSACRIQRKRHSAVVVDRLMRMSRFAPCRTTITVKETARLLISAVVRVHGIPVAIISDLRPKVHIKVLARHVGSVRYTPAILIRLSSANGRSDRDDKSNNGELQDKLDYLLAKGFIRPSTSPVAAPSLFTPKKDGGLWISIDYRALNRVTIKSRYPIPCADKLIDKLRGARYFSKIDLLGDYHQIRVFANDCQKTTSRTRYGSYEYTVMPFGFTNTPSTFQLTMNGVFRDLLDKCVIIYLDDILIYSTTQQQYLKDLEAVFQRLQQNCLITNGSKCRDRRSDIAIGAVLLQDFGDGLQPIAYESRKLQSAKRNYPVHDKEMLAIVHAFKVWRFYLTGADQDTWNRYGTRLQFSSTYHLQTDGQTERTNQTMEQLIRTNCSDICKWEDSLPMLEFSYNNEPLLQPIIRPSS
ncbi:hypothetical protein CLOM_g23531, partial [Closterium sp. NIES-68]